MDDRFTFRAAEPRDLEEMAATVHEGFEGYREFADPGWEPPPQGRTLESITHWHNRPGTWSLVALADNEIAGHVTVIPTLEAREPPRAPDLAELWQLCVRRPFWGTGVARRLRNAALEQAANAYERIHLYTPLGQARARRFYSREGWAEGGRFQDTQFGMELVEYRRPLCRVGPDGPGGRGEAL